MLSTSSPSPTIPRLKQAREIVDYWAEQFGMRRWRITVEVGRDMAGSTAHTHVIWNYDDTCIEIQPWVLGIGTPPSPDSAVSFRAADDDFEFERLLVHELLHAFMRRHARAAAKLSEQLPEGLRPAFEVLRSDADEEIVDILSRVLVTLRHADPQFT